MVGIRTAFQALSTQIVLVPYCWQLFCLVAHSDKLQARHTPVHWVKVEFGIGLRENDRDPHHLSFIHLEMTIAYFLSERYKGQVHKKQNSNLENSKKYDSSLLWQCILRQNKSIKVFDLDMEILFKYIWVKAELKG